MGNSFQLDKNISKILEVHAEEEMPLIFATIQSFANSFSYMRKWNEWDWTHSKLNGNANEAKVKESNWSQLAYEKNVWYVKKELMGTWLYGMDDTESIKSVV